MDSLDNNKKFMMPIEFIGIMNFIGDKYKSMFISFFLYDGCYYNINTVTGSAVIISLNISLNGNQPRVFSTGETNQILRQAITSECNLVLPIQTWCCHEDFEKNFKNVWFRWVKENIQNKNFNIIFDDI